MERIIITVAPRSDELYHHGVKGMKWGVRKKYEPVGKRTSPKNTASKGKNAVLKSVNPNRSRKNAGAKFVKKHLSVKTNSGDYTDAVKAGGLFRKSKSKNSSQNLTEADLQRIDPSKNTKAIDFQVINRDLNITEGIRNAQEQFSPQMLQKLPADERKLQMQNFKDGNLMNCTMCSAAAHMRAKGYDVVAGKSTRGLGPDRILSWYKGAEFESMSGAKMTDKSQLMQFSREIYNRANMNYPRNVEAAQLSKRLSSMGNGAYGSLMVLGKNGGHCVEFRVEKGTAKVYDNQLGKEYKSVEEFFNKVPHHEPSKSFFARIDNVQPDVNEMLRQGVIKPR